jgi:dTDP-4-dehydrorhamnose reductase
MSKKILIFGRGFIGERLQENLKCSLTDQRIESYYQIEEAIKKNTPKVIINCIGHTGKSNVDDCEMDIDKTISANTFVPLLMGEAALRHNIKLIHISSGCIYHFDYNKPTPIPESRIPDFYGLYYSRTKIYAELALNELSKRANILIARIRIPLDNRPHPRNILDKIIRYKTIIDIPNSVTYIPDFIAALKHLLRIDARGIYNVVNKGGLYYKDLLDEYRRYKPDFQYSFTDLRKLKLIRTNLIMSTTKLERSGFPVRPVKTIIPECVKGYVQSR